MTGVWATEEFAGAALGDERLNQRLVKLVYGLLTNSRLAFMKRVVTGRKRRQRTGFSSS